MIIGLEVSRSGHVSSGGRVVLLVTRDNILGGKGKSACKCVSVFCYLIYLTISRKQLAVSLTKCYT